MSGALEIAAVGLRAQQRALEAIAGNVSNINTPAYKRSDLRFAELVAGPAVGLRLAADAGQSGVAGVAEWSRPMVDQQGKLKSTGNAFDIAVDGAGFIELMGPAGRTLLWRGGTLRVLDDGLLATADGLALKAAITVPRDAAAIRVERDGTVYAASSADGGESEIGRIDLVKLEEGAAIERRGRGVYAAGDDAELAVAPAGEEGLGHIVQGSLERSNVDLNEEMVGLLVTQRAYAANAQVIRAVDEFLSLANGLRRS
jgi:flagellar basal-body rod protein FlgG